MYITGIDNCGRTSYISHSNHILCGFLLPRLSAEDVTAVLHILSPCVDFDVDNEDVLLRFGNRIKRESGAHATAGSATLFLILYTGYAIPKPSMVAGLRWFISISVSDTLMLKVNMLPDRRSLLRAVSSQWFGSNSFERVRHN